MVVSTKIKLVINGGETVAAAEILFSLQASPVFASASVRIICLHSTDQELCLKIETVNRINSHVTTQLVSR
jgi:hypothetical protein